MARNFGQKNPIAITVDMDSKGAIKNIKKLTGSIAGIGLAGGAAVLGVAALGGAMALAAAKASQHAAKLELIQNKTKIVFGDQLPLIRNWSEQTAQSFGLTAINLEGMGAGFADLLIPMGFAREQAAQMTMDVVGLAGAMSEWSAGTRTVEDTTRILARAMLGEREMLKDLGVDIRELDIKQRLMAKGQEDLTGNFLKQARAVATMEMIFERSKDAQTGFANGSESLTRKTREMSARFQEMVQAIQLQLLPHFKKLADRITDEVIPKMEKDLFPVLEELIKTFTEVLPGAIDNTIHFLELLQTGFENTKHAAGLLEGTLDDIGATSEKFIENFAKVAIVMTAFIAMMGPTGALVAAAFATSVGLAAVSSKLFDMAQEAFATSKELSDHKKMLDEANSAYQDAEIDLEEFNAKMKEAAGTTQELSDEFGEGKEKTDKWADAVKQLSDRMQRLTAEQYATEIATSLMAERGLGTSEAALQDFIDFSVEKLRRLIGKESELERVKNELLERAGFNFSSGRSSSSDDDDGIDDTKILQTVIQKLDESQILTDEIAKGWARFQFNFEEIFQQQGGASIGMRVGAEAFGVPTLAEAMDKAFVMMVNEHGLGPKATEALAANFAAQALQQEIGFSSLGPVLRGNVPGASTQGSFVGRNQETGDIDRPIDPIPGVPQQFFITNNITGVVTEEVIEQFAEGFVESTTFKQPGMQNLMFGT